VVGRRSCRCDLALRPDSAEEESPQPHEDADLLGRLLSWTCSFCRYGRRRRDTWNGGRDDCCRWGRGSGFPFRFIDHWGRSDGNQMTDRAVLGQRDLIIANSPNFVLRRLHVAIRNQHHLRIALGFDAVEPLALLVHEIRGDFDWKLGDNFDGAILTRLFADQSQQGECQRINTADCAHAVTAGARDAG